MRDSDKSVLNRQQQAHGDRRSFLKKAAASVAALSGAELAFVKAANSAEAEMPAKELGTTGLKMPIIGLGTSQSLDPVYDKVLHGCFNNGVTAFDTALSYGHGASHAAIANFIEQMEDRKKLIITSKSGSRDTGGLSNGLDQALEELKTDYVDLFFMHGVNDADMLEPDYIKLGEQMRASGKTNFFGFSCHDGNVVELMEKAAKVGGIDAILFRYNFRRYGDQELNVAIDNCHKAGIGLIAMKTMGSVPKKLESVVDFRSRDFSLAQAKLKSVWADERIDSIVSEMDSVKVARENIAAAKTEKDLTAADLQQLNRLAALTADYACNGCNHLCENAIAGDTAIADQLRYLMYYECYDKPQRARELFAELPESRKCFDVDELKLAASACPQGIDIASRLKQASEQLG